MYIVSQSHVRKISGNQVRSDFNDLPAVMYYTRAAHDLGLWKSERILIERLFPDTSAHLIEAGCGAGRVTLGLWALGYRRITAFDFADELLDQARCLAAARDAAGITFLHADATRLPFRSAGDAADGNAAPPDTAAASDNNCARRAPDTASKKVGLALRDGLDFRNRRQPTDASHIPAKAASEKRPHRKDSLRTPSPTMVLPLHGGFAGALFMFNGLMQIPGRDNRRAALRELHRVCAPGAPLLFTSHDRDSSATERALWRLETLRWVRGEQDPRLVEFGDRYFEDAAGRTFMHLPDRAEVLADLASTGWIPLFDAMRSEVARESRAVREFSDECRFWAARRAG
jgi:ubiquinone/menaquinone biosynthesis C-methylase UbiE